MSKGELIDSRVSLDQCKLAVEALSAHETKKEQERQETELLPGKEQFIWLIVASKKMPSAHKFKPTKIPIVHPLVDPRTSPICLITKDPQREYKDLLDTHGIKFISRVVGLEKLKGKFKPFEARRMLLKENGLFLADEKIIPLLPKLLGSKWFDAKKQPIPVCLTRKDLKGELERAVSSTYMNQNQGTCTSIKISTLSHTPEQILANLKTALPAIAKNIKDGWDNIQSLGIKTNSSVTLPIWNCNLDVNEGGRWAGLTPKLAGDVDAESDKEEEDEAIKAKEEEVTKKGKKRAAETEQGTKEEAKPKKKAKGVEGKALITEPSTPAKSKPKAAVVPPAAAVSSPASKPKSDPTTISNPITKKKKSRASIVDIAPVPEQVAAVAETKPADGPSPKKKKSRASVSDAASIPQQVADVPASKPAAGSTSSVVPTTSPSIPETKLLTEKVKKTKQPKAADDDAGKVTKESTPLTKDELKQKRGAGEKKKEKVVKARGGKSVKDGVIGKKPAQG